MGELLNYTNKIKNLNDQKAAFKNCNTPDSLSQRIVEEAVELQESIYQDMEAFPVGREIGDVLYLTLVLCAELGFNPKDLLDLTIKRNEVKYPKERLSGDCNQETIKSLKQEWKDKGDDVVWSHTIK